MGCNTVPNFEPTEVGSSWSRGCQRLSVGVPVVFGALRTSSTKPYPVATLIPECGWENHGAPGVLMLTLGYTSWFPTNLPL